MIIELIALSALSIVMAIILVSYWKLDRKYKALQRRETQMLNTAHHKAEEIVSQARQKAITSISTAQVDIEGKLNIALDKVSKKVQQDTMSKLNQTLEEYRLRKLNQMDKDFRQVLLDAASKVLHKTLSLAEHEALIIKSLEQAKNQHVL